MTIAIAGLKLLLAVKLTTQPHWLDGEIKRDQRWDDIGRSTKREKRQPKMMQASIWIWIHGFEFKSGTKEEKPLLFGASMGQGMGSYHSKCRGEKNAVVESRSTFLQIAAFLVSPSGHPQRWSMTATAAAGMAKVAAAAAAARVGQQQRVVANGEGRWKALSDI